MRAAMRPEQQCSPRRTSCPLGCRPTCRTGFGVLSCTRFGAWLGRYQSSSIRESDRPPHLRKALSQPGERCRAVDGETCAGGRVGVVAKDLAGNGLAIDVAEDHERGTQSGAVRRVARQRCVGRRRNHFRHRHAAATRCAQHRNLGANVAWVALALTLQDQPAATSDETPGLTRGTTGQAAEIADLGVQHS